MNSRRKNSEAPARSVGASARVAVSHQSAWSGAQTMAFEMRLGLAVTSPSRTLLQPVLGLAATTARMPLRAPSPPASSTCRLPARARALRCPVGALAASRWKRSRRAGVIDAGDAAIARASVGAGSVASTGLPAQLSTRDVFHEAGRFAGGAALQS